MTVENGEKIEIIGDDSIKIYSTIISKVLLVKNCATNLLSIRKLTNELNYELIFSSTNVVFQELISKKVIGEGLMKNELYYLNHKKLNLNVRREDQLSALWHRRAGHPSDKVLKNSFYFSNIDNSSCESCKLEKFTKLSFNISSCKSEKLFYLIHSDVCVNL
jgi:GAG-pre-integrase domain